jgi:hypothetical protein
LVLYLFAAIFMLICVETHAFVLCVLKLTLLLGNRRYSGRQDDQTFLACATGAKHEQHRAMRAALRQCVVSAKGPATFDTGLNIPPFQRLLTEGAAFVVEQLHGSLLFAATRVSPSADAQIFFLAKHSH